MDNEQVTLLALLDLSAAFYCVDHDILLSKLQSSFGLGGITLTWILSCLTDRSQRVLLDQWMGFNRLKLNAHKTQLFWIGTGQQLAKQTTI